MTTLQKIKKRYVGSICRQCLNQLYHLDLTPDDCRYENFCPSMCPRCGELQNIVGRIRLWKRIKLYFK